VESQFVVGKRFTALENGVATVELTVENTGTAPAFDLELTDEFDEAFWDPASFNPVSVPPAHELSALSASGTTTVTLAVDGDPTVSPAVLAPGDAITTVFTLALQNDGVLPVTAIPNTATATVSSLPGPEPAERSYSESASDTLFLPELALRKSWSGPNDPALPGDTLRYLIELENTGQAPAEAVVISDTPDAIGELQPGSVSASAGGSLLSGNAPGDTAIEVAFPQVSAGQTLVELDSGEMQAQLEAAQAMRAEAEAAIAAAGQATAAAEAQRDLAASTHKRFEELLGKKSVAQQEYDEVAARLRSAEAGLALARSQQSQAEAKRAQADAAIAQANLMLGYAKVSAPVNGVVTSRMVDPGALASPGMPLLEIEQGGGYRLEVAVPESDAGRLHPDQEMAIRIDALGDESPTSGRIVEIVPAVDPGSRTFIAKIALPNHPLLRSGLYGKAFLAGRPRESLTVPLSAVVERGQLRSVFVVEGGQVRRRLVTLGEQRAGRLEVLSGLTAGDEVVLNPESAVDGAPVGGRS